MLVTTAVFLIAYLALLLFLYVNQRAFLFIRQNRPPVADEQQITIDAGGANLHGYIVNPNQADAVLYFGGNAEQASDNIPLYRELLPEVTTYLFDYRGYGLSGGEPTEANLFADALRIYDAIAQRHQKLHVIGRSLGSGVAVYLASRREPNKLVLITPYDSIERVAATHYPIFPTRYLIKDRFDSRRYVPAIRADTLVFKAQTDRVVPHRHTDALLQFFRHQTPETFVLGGTDHVSIVGTAEYALRLRSFFERN